MRLSSRQLFAATCVLLALAAILVVSRNADPVHNPGNDADHLRQLRDGGAVIVRSADGLLVDSITFTRNRVRPSHIELLPHVGPIRSLSFDACRQMDVNWLTPLGSLRSLKSLNLGGTGVGDDCTSIVGTLTALKELFLWRTHVSDDGVKALQYLPELEVLNLWDTATTDAVIDILIEMPRLRRVYLGSSPEPQTDFQEGVWQFPASDLTASAVQRLRDTRPDLTVIYWSAGHSKEAPQMPAIAVDSGVPATATRFESPTPEADSSASLDSDWPGFLGLNGDGSSRELLPPQDWNSRPPLLLWQRQTGEGLSAPSIAQGRLVYTDRKADEERIYCVDSRTGTKLWQTAVPVRYEDALGYSNGPRSSPVIDGSRVYTMTAEGVLWCRRVDDGRELWMCDTTTEFRVLPNLYGVGSTPVIFGDLLIALIGGEKSLRNEAADTRPAAVVAFNKFTGEVRYATCELRASYSSLRLTQLSGRTYGVGFGREGVLLFDAAHGAQLDFEPWAAKVSGCVNAATPLLNGDRVLVSEAYGPGSALFRIQGEELSLEWRDPKKSRQRSLRAHWATPVLQDGYLYGCSGRHSADGRLRCVEWATGEVKWDEPQQSLSSLCLIDGFLINLTEFGVVELIAARAESCQRVGRFVPGVNGGTAAPNDERLLKYPCWTAPVYSGGILFLRGKDRIAAFELSAEAESQRR